MLLLAKLLAQHGLGPSQRQAAIHARADGHNDDQTDDQVHEKFFGRHPSRLTHTESDLQLLPLQILRA